MDDLRSYLMHHLGAADTAVALLERCAEDHADDSYGEFFARLLAEVREDRAALSSMFTRIGGKRGPLRKTGTWIAERLGRIRVADGDGDAPELALLELFEALSLAVAGKEALWDALGAAAGDTGRFGGLSLERLKRRAADQRRDIESRRQGVAAALFAVDEDALELPPAHLRAVILDVDGTLVDSNDQHARAWVDAFARSRHDVSYEQVRPLIGMGGDQLLPTLVGVDADSDEGQKLERDRGEIFKADYLAECTAMPGARALLERLRAGGLTLVIATSASGDDLDALLNVAGVKDLIDAATSADDADESKPEPDIVNAAVRRAGCEPEEAIMIGDTPFDVAAAREAGVAIVGVRCGGSGDAELADALAIYADPADLLERFADSPFAAALAPAPEA